MKTRNLKLGLAKCALTGLLTVSAELSSAQQSTVFTYQGRMTDSGTNFAGTGQFKFALVTGTNTSATATATATVSPPFVIGYTVTLPGSGYTAAPTVTISGGGGSNAAATANISGGMVTSLTPVSAGSGYSSAPTVTIAAPPPAISYTTYWSNDGTSSGGSEPSSAVSVGVSNGLFIVGIGDTNLPNMQAIAASLFIQPNLKLVIWFNDGVNGFVPLMPPQPLTATPYADMANTASNLLGTLSAGQLSGTIAATLLPGSVLTNGAANVTLTGSFAGSGAGVTNISLLSVNPQGLFSVLSPFFAPAVTINAGIGPYSVVAVDVNGDGKLDLVSANYLASGTLTVLTNNGNGVFGSNATVMVGSGPLCVVAADVNGDGKPDLISANTAASTLTVVTNNGNGGFVLSATLPLSPGAGPYYVAVADINGDGKPDLIASDTFADNTLTVFTNNGSGVFGSNATLIVGHEPNQVAVADINGDGSPDLICANYVSGTLTVLTNNGHGIFGLNATINVDPGGGAVSVVATNIRGGRLPDLICSDVNSNTLVVFTNNGSGVFGSNATLSVGNHPQSVVAADLNGDGFPDLIAADAGSTTLTVLTNNGSGVFGFNATLNVGPGPWQVVAADLNGDGTPDLISANGGGSTLTVVVTHPSALDFGNLALGSGLIDLNASQLTSGTVPLAQLPGAVVTNGEIAITLNGTFSGNGSGLMNLNASQLTSGTVPLAQLPSSVAQLAGSQIFTGIDVFAGGLSVNTGAGTVAFAGQLVPTLDVSGGSVSGHMRLRNALEIWPNDAATAGGYLDVRNLSGLTTIVLNGTNGNITTVTLTQTSDRNVKENFTRVDPQAVLARVAALPITEWSFKMDQATRHIGPTAQDFRAAFEVGTDDKHIATVDEEGVALAAIQGLNQRLDAKDAEIQDLKQENALLSTRLSEVEAMLNKLATTGQAAK